MVKILKTLKVVYQGQDVGALSVDPSTGQCTFMYMPEFIKTGIELSPLMMPLRENYIYSFDTLSPEAFKGLPGMLTDSLPDDFGNRILNAWLALKGDHSLPINPIDQLRYIGKRGMGALEFLPAKARGELNTQDPVHIEELVATTQKILSADYRHEIDSKIFLPLVRVATSAGGKRPKAILAFNEDFKKVLPGQTNVPPGYKHYLVKFDSLREGNIDRETINGSGLSAVEYVYHQMAIFCGIDMMPCYLLNEGNSQHFMTQRFDRIGNEKLHVQTLSALAHVDYKSPGSFSYEQLFILLNELKMTAVEADQILKRMIFNIVTCNLDDHAKNFSFILRDRKWQLAPAYDLTYSYAPGSFMGDLHWMSLNGKRKNFNLEDILSVQSLDRKFTPRYVLSVLEHTIEVATKWDMLAKAVAVPEELIEKIAENLKLKF